MVYGGEFVRGLVLLIVVGGCFFDCYVVGVFDVDECVGVGGVDYFYGGDFFVDYVFEIEGEGVVVFFVVKCVVGDGEFFDVVCLKFVCGEYVEIGGVVLVYVEFGWELVGICFWVIVFGEEMNVVEDDVFYVVGVLFVG